MISLGALFKESFQTVKSDWIIATPFWIFFFTFQSISVSRPHLFTLTTSISLTNILIFVSISLCELFIKCIVMCLSENNSFKYAFNRTSQQYPKILLSSILLLLPILCIFSLLSHSTQFSFIEQMLTFVAATIFGIPSMLLLQLLPLPYLIKNESLLPGIIKTWHLVKTNVLTIIRYMLWILTAFLTAIIISSLFTPIPIIGKSIIYVGIQGLVSTINAIFTIKVYYYLTNTHQTKELNHD